MDVAKGENRTREKMLKESKIVNIISSFKLYFQVCHPKCSSFGNGKRSFWFYVIEFWRAGIDAPARDFRFSSGMDSDKREGSKDSSLSSKFCPLV